MQEIEAMLRDESRELDRLTVPEELEDRLRAALKTKRKRRPYILAAAAAVFLLLFAYNFSAVAYYARQILGFDQVMTGTLKDLNELGRGQIIDRSCTLDSGIRFTLEGIMVDGNRLIAFITQENMSADPYETVPHFEIRGLLGKRYGSTSGYGEYNDDRSVIKYIFNFEPPGPLERNLTLGLSCLVDGLFEESKIGFRLDRSKAMGFSLRERIRRTIILEGGGRLDLDSIAVSPSMTAIEGSLLLPQGGFCPGEPFPQSAGMHLELKLFADGREIAFQGGHLGSRTPGKYNFKMEFDTLPPDSSTIKIKLASLTARKELDRLVELASGDLDIPLELEGNAVTLRKLEIGKDRTVLTLSTGSKNPLIEAACISAGEVSAALIGIEGGSIEETGAEQITVQWRLIFEGLPRSDRYDLEIGAISYSRDCDQSVTVPVAE